MSQNLIFSQDALERYVRDRKKLDLAIKITAGVPSILGTEDPKILIERGLAGSQVLLTQTNIDDLLGVADDVDADVAFGSTAMVADNTLGFVLACDGQVESVDVAAVNITAVATALSEEVSSLPNSAFTGLQILVTPAGNIAGRLTSTAVTAAATNTLLCISLYLRLK